MFNITARINHTANKTQYVKGGASQNITGLNSQVDALLKECKTEEQFQLMKQIIQLKIQNVQEQVNNGTTAYKNYQELLDIAQLPMLHPAVRIIQNGNFTERLRAAKQSIMNNDINDSNIDLILGNMNDSLSKICDHYDKLATPIRSIFGTDYTDTAENLIRYTQTKNFDTSTDNKSNQQNHYNVIKRSTQSLIFPTQQQILSQNPELPEMETKTFDYQESIIITPRNINPELINNIEQNAISGNENAPWVAELNNDNTIIIPRNINDTSFIKDLGEIYPRTLDCMVYNISSERGYREPLGSIRADYNKHKNTSASERMEKVENFKIRFTERIKTGLSSNESYIPTELIKDIYCAPVLTKTSIEYRSADGEIITPHTYNSNRIFTYRVDDETRYFIPQDQYFGCTYACTNMLALHNGISVAQLRKQHDLLSREGKMESALRQMMMPSHHIQTTELNNDSPRENTNTLRNKIDSHGPVIASLGGHVIMVHKVHENGDMDVFDPFHAIACMVDASFINQIKKVTYATPKTSGTTRMITNVAEDIKNNPENDNSDED